MKSANRTYKLQTTDVQSEVTEVLRAEHTDTFKKLSGELPSWLLSVVTVKRNHTITLWIKPTRGESVCYTSPRQTSV